MHNIILAFLSIFITQFSFAQVNTRTLPPFAHGGQNAVYLDFQSAQYKMVIEYEYYQATAVVKSKIEFEQFEQGYPVFDLVVEPNSVKLNGMMVETSVVSNGTTNVRVINTSQPPGRYTLEVEHELLSDSGGHIEGMAMTEGGGFRLFFHMSDLQDRSLLEKYLPTSFEYDQYSFSYDIELNGFSEDFQLFTNGNALQRGKNRWEIDFPPYFNCASPFTLILPKEQVSLAQDTYESISGKSIPVSVLYHKHVNDQNNRAEFLKYVKETIAAFENDFGPYAHDSFLYYGVGSFGYMEYAGAATGNFSKDVFEHELLHSFFARAVMPHDGDALWIDEAVVTWVTSERWRNKHLHNPAPLAGISPYSRSTPRWAYRKGADFIGQLDKKIRPYGMMPILRTLYKEYMYKTITTTEFRKLIERESGLDLKEDFESLPE